MGAGDERESRDDHQHNFQQLDASHEQRLLVFVGQLARCRRKQEERQDEQHGGNVRKLAVIHARDEHALKGHEYDQTLAKYVVVKGAEKLRNEERGEAALTE